MWIEVSVEVHPVAHEAVSAFLFDLGCRGVVLGDKGNSSLKAYLPMSVRLEEVRNRMEVFLGRLREIFPEAAQSAFDFSKLQEEDWSLTWKRHFHVERITERLTVVPVWEPVPQGPGDMVIRMDPGPAFGTGSHPTTRMCLESIEDFHTPGGALWAGAGSTRGTAQPAEAPVLLRRGFAGHPPSSKFQRPGLPAKAGAWTMLDVGTGSGILAIYAAKLGAEKILAIDTDPEALRWARRNIDLNLCSQSIDLSSKPVGELNGAFPVLVANLTRDALLSLLPEFQRLIEKDGVVILSGLLHEQVQEVKTPLEQLGFEAIRVITQAEWACITARSLE